MCETSRKVNHRLLYFLNAVYFGFSIAMLASGAWLVGQYELMTMLPGAQRMAVGVVCLGSFLLTMTCFGCFGVRKRNQCYVLIYLCMMVILLGLQLIMGYYLYQFSREDELDRYIETDLKTGWETLAAEAETDSDVRSWMQDIQIQYSCCGWDVMVDETQNPSWLECSEEHTSLCSDVFAEEVEDMLAPVALVALILTSIQATFLFLSCGFLCRLKKYYKPVVVDFGDLNEPFERQGLRDKAEEDEDDTVTCESCQGLC